MRNQTRKQCIQTPRGKWPQRLLTRIDSAAMRQVLSAFALPVSQAAIRCMLTENACAFQVQQAQHGDQACLVSNSMRMICRGLGMCQRLLAAYAWPAFMSSRAADKAQAAARSAVQLMELGSNLGPTTQLGLRPKIATRQHQELHQKRCETAQQRNMHADHGSHTLFSSPCLGCCALVSHIPHFYLQINHFNLRVKAWHVEDRQGCQSAG